MSQSRLAPNASLSKVSAFCALALLSLVLLVGMAGFGASAKAAEGELIIPINRSQIISTPSDMQEIIVSNPDIADIHVHGARSASVIGKKYGKTNVRVFDKEGGVIESYDVTVSYDLPAIRRTLNKFLPNEHIKLDVVNTNLVLSGEVSNADAANRAVTLVNEYLNDRTTGPAVLDKDQKEKSQGVVNLMQITTGQQVMLRVRVGEIKRTALKQLGLSLAAQGTGNPGFQFGTGGGINSFVAGQNGNFKLTPDQQGLLGFTVGGPGVTLQTALEALEENGLFKVLAEPNLVALSGEKADFLAGGEFPIPVSQGGNGTGTTVTIEYRQFGVGVQFTPFVLSENRIRMIVQPEVSELSDEGAVTLNGFTVPGLHTRRAKTTVELAPGESFMIAGLISDNMQSKIRQLPGLGEVPILGALFRSTDFQRNETELVIAVTPYLVDPLKGSDVRLPTDNLQPASDMEAFFYGALGTLSGDAERVSQTPPLEGPIGYMVD